MQFIQALKEPPESPKATIVSRIDMDASQSWTKYAAVASISQATPTEIEKLAVQMGAKILFSSAIYRISGVRDKWNF